MCVCVYTCVYIYIYISFVAKAMLVLENMADVTQSLLTKKMAHTPPLRVVSSKTRLGEHFVHHWKVSM